MKWPFADKLGAGVARRGGLHRRSGARTMEVRSDRTPEPARERSVGSFPGGLVCHAQPETQGFLRLLRRRGPAARPLGLRRRRTAAARAAHRRRRGALGILRRHARDQALREELLPLRAVGGPEREHALRRPGSRAARSPRGGVRRLRPRPPAGHAARPSPPLRDADAAVRGGAADTRAQGPGAGGAPRRQGDRHARRTDLGERAAQSASSCSAATAAGWSARSSCSRRWRSRSARSWRAKSSGRSGRWNRR